MAMRRIENFMIICMLLLLLVSVDTYGQTKKVVRQRSVQTIVDHPKPNLNKGNRPVFKSESFTNGNLVFITINNKEVEVKANKEIKPKGEIVIPENVIHKGKSYKVTQIGYEAFGGCDSLQAISIPSSVERIDNYAFTGANIRKIHIPPSVKDINQFSLYGIKESVNVDELNKDYSSVNGVLYNKDKSVLYLWPPKNSVGSKLVIPHSVKKVFDQAFWHTEFSSVTISPEIDYWNGCFDFCKIDTLVILDNSISDRDPFNSDTKIRIAIISHNMYEKVVNKIFYPSDNNIDMFMINYPDGKKELKVWASVDLGLPSGTLWAKFNVGATKPEEYGEYFAWGETCPKDNYTVSNYKWFNSRIKDPIKYNTKVWPVKGDDKNILDLEDDAAYVNWGNKWCLPSFEQVHELKEHCRWIWTALNDVVGYKVIGPNGKSIFLPAAGFCDNEMNSKNLGVNGNYWTIDLHTGYNHSAYALLFKETEGVDVDDKYRDEGLSIRPVRK